MPGCPILWHNKPSKNHPVENHKTPDKTIKKPHPEVARIISTVSCIHKTIRQPQTNCKKTIETMTKPSTAGVALLGGLLADHSGPRGGICSKNVPQGSKTNHKKTIWFFYGFLTSYGQIKKP